MSEIELIESTNGNCCDSPERKPIITSRAEGVEFKHINKNENRVVLLSGNHENIKDVINLYIYICYLVFFKTK